MSAPQIACPCPCTSKGRAARSDAPPFSARLEDEIVLRALSRLPHRRLSELLAYIDAGKRYADVLARSRVCDLVPPAGIIDLALLGRAQRAQGEAYDALVLGVVRQAYPSRVDATYLRARVGGPRWKLQKSLGRLVHRQLLQRSGKTSGTRYLAEPEDA